MDKSLTLTRPGARQKCQLTKIALLFLEQARGLSIQITFEEKPSASSPWMSVTLAYTARAPCLFAPNATEPGRILLRPAGGKALAAQDWPSARRLKGHAVGFAALVTGNLETLAVATTAACASCATEIGAPAIATSLAALRLAEVSFIIIFLFTFGEWELRAALGASDLYIWHVQLLPAESRREVCGLPCFDEGPGARPFQNRFRRSLSSSADDQSAFACETPL